MEVVGPDATVIALEVSCAAGTCGVFHKKCRLRRRFANNGGRENVERLLKTWVLLGPSVEDYPSHRDITLPAPLTSLEELETRSFSKAVIVKGQGRGKARGRPATQGRGVK